MIDNKDRIERKGTLTVADEHPLPADPLPKEVTPEWLVETFRSLGTQLKFDLVAVVDEVVRRRLDSKPIQPTTACGDSDTGLFQKPLLTCHEAAAFLSLSEKRFENIICEERARLGRSPDFIVDAGGRIQRRVLRDELLVWAKGRSKRARRTSIARSFTR